MLCKFTTFAQRICTTFFVGKLNIQIHYGNGKGDGEVNGEEGKG